MYVPKKKQGPKWKKQAGHNTNKQRLNQISKIPNKQEPKQDFNIKATTKTNKWRTNQTITNKCKKH